jgi:hypothetical protein
MNEMLPVPAWCVNDAVDRALRACAADRCVVVRRDAATEATCSLFPLLGLPTVWSEEMGRRGETGAPDARWLVIIDAVEDKTTFHAISPRGAIS